MAERKWSSQQQAIFANVANGTGHLVVRARAGTGKTTTVTEAVTKHAPRGTKVLVAAFNKRIQLELEARLRGSSVEAKTLHALGYGFIRTAWGNVNSNDSDTVDFERARNVLVDEARAHNLAPAGDETAVVVKNLAAKLKNMAPLSYDIGEVIDIAQQFGLEPNETDERAGWTLERVARAAGKARDAALDRDAFGRISFDDMVYVAVANDLVRPRYDLVVIDEAQDMNAAQLLLAQAVCKKGGRIVVVGDDRQAIYGFRGADAGGIDRLKAELGATELGLTVTYRCGKVIVDLARALVSDFEAYEDNAQGVIDSCTTDALYEQAKPGDFVLSRKNAPLMGLALGFLKRGVRARIEGRDIGKALRATVAGLKARSVPHYIERAQAWGAKQAKRAAKIAKEEARERRLAEIADQTEVLLVLAEGANNVADILARCETLFSESRDEKIPTVVLSSVHKAKGLEASRVFIIESTVNQRTTEEQNIYYVAVTRAIKHLTWVREVK